MDGMWSSQHILKVVPNPSKVPPGYLFAYLSSKFGVPLVVGGTYGAIIQHIEPQHVSGLPVPRLGDEIERRIHDLVHKAAMSLSESSSLFRKATNDLLQQLGIQESSDAEWHADTSALGWAENGVSQESFRAFNYDPRALSYHRKLARTRNDELGSLCDPKYFKGKIIFKRIDAEPQYGAMLVGQRQAFQLRPDGRWISTRSIEGLGLKMPPGTTLIPSHGTLGEHELYCRAVIVTKKTSEYAFSGDFFRCVPDRQLIEPGYLFAFLRSRLAFRLLRSISTGGKQQEQHIQMMRRFPIPRLGREEESAIAECVERASCLYDLAIESEDKARSLVEDAIEEAS